MQIKCEPISEQEHLLNVKKFEIQQQIAKLKQKLRETDYQAIKYAEGRITQEEYQSISNQRQEWRDKINDLERKV